MDVCDYCLYSCLVLLMLCLSGLSALHDNMPMALEVYDGIMLCLSGLSALHDNMELVRPPTEVVSVLLPFINRELCYAWCTFGSLS